MSGTVFQGTTLTGLITGRMVSYTITPTDMLEVDNTSSTDTERQYISGNLKEQPEYTFDLVYDGTLPTVGTIANQTITYSDASVDTFSGFLKSVGKPSGSLGDGSAQKYSVVVRRLGAAV